MSEYHRVEHSETVATGATSAPVKVYNIHPNIGFSLPLTVVGIIPNGSAAGTSATIQYTTSPVSAIDAGTANWRNWTAGAATATTEEVVTKPISGVRCISATGPVVFEVLG